MSHGQSSSSASALQPWQRSVGTQWPYHTLESPDCDGLMNEAARRGADFKRRLDWFAGSRHTTLDPRQDVLFERAYEVEEGPIAAQTRFSNIDETYAQAGISHVYGDVDFTFSSVYSVTPGERFPNGARAPALSIAANPHAGSLIPFSAYTKYDGNNRESRVHPSNLAWRAWESIAGSRACHLKTVLLHNIENQETLNVMALVHERNAEYVDQIPRDRANQPLGPAAGRLKTTCRYPDFHRLLSTPVIRPIVNMLLDRQDRLVNPYITEIHTFPKVDRDIFPMMRSGQLRAGYSIIVLGQKPINISIY